jgi:hypothetical protein
MLELMYRYVQYYLLIENNKAQNMGHNLDKDTKLASEPRDHVQYVTSSFLHHGTPQMISEA